MEDVNHLPVDRSPSDYLVYALVDPRSGQWRYIGKSSSGLKRPRDHESPSLLKRSDRTHRANWIRQLLRLGLHYTIEILEEFASPIPLYEVEQEWIASARAVGVDLTNKTDGGPGVLGLVHSDSTKKLLSEIVTRYFPDPINREAHAYRISVRSSDPEVRRRMSDSASRHWQKESSRVEQSRRRGGGEIADDTGRVFSTISEAARHHGTYPSAIRKMMTGQLKTTAGHTFSRISPEAS